MTRGHNIIADEWAEESTPIYIQISPTPNPKKKDVKWLFFHLYNYFLNNTGLNENENWIYRGGGGNFVDFNFFYEILQLRNQKLTVSFLH